MQNTYRNHYAAIKGAKWKFIIEFEIVQSMVLWHDYSLLVEFEVERTVLNSIEELLSKSHKSIHISWPNNFWPYKFILRKYLPGKTSIFAQIDSLQQR